MPQAAARCSARDFHHELGRALGETHTATCTLPATSTRAISTLSSRITTSAGRLHFEATDLRQAEDARRDGGGRVDRLSERDAELVQVLHRLDHGQRAAGEDAVGPADCPAAHLHVEAPEGIGAVARTGGSNRIGDERDSPGRRAPHDLNDLRREVHSVEDQLDDHVVADEGRPDDAGIPMQHRAHRVEEMGARSNAEVECRVRLVGGRIAMTERDGDAALEQALD